MHILQLCRLTPLWGVDLCKQVSLAHKVHDVTTVFLSGKPDSTLEKQYHGKIIFFEIDHKKPLWRFKAAVKLWKLCRQQAFDKVICNHYKPMVIMDWVSYFLPPKAYFSMHHTSGNLRRLGRRLYTRLSLNRRWTFIAVSQWVKADLQKARAGVLAQQVKVIYNAIVLEELHAKQLSREKARESLGLTSQQFVWGTIGRLVSSKRHSALIAAFSAVSAKMPDAVLVILGTGPLEAALRQQIERLQLSNRVFIHSTYAKQANTFIQAFDAFVFPSMQEGFGLVLLEAMSAQLPIIAADNGGIPEVMGETGMLFSLQDEALQQALLQLYALTEIERLQMGLIGYQRLCQYFLQEHFAAAWKEVAA
jgi:glycosyltransferase involved in cell wall biosynthesis